MITNKPPREKIITLISENTKETKFDITVVLDCIKSTESIVWNNKTINWFYRMDYIPANLEETFKKVVRSIFW